MEADGFGLKLSKNERNESSSIDNFDNKSNKTAKHTSNLPPGIFGETKRVEVTHYNDSTSDLAAINATIKLLKEYLNDTSDELQHEKTEDTENLKEDRH